MDFFFALPAHFQALLAGLFTWFATGLGAALVFFFKKINARLLNMMLGFAAGIMLAASVWGLLDPSFTYSAQMYRIIWVVPVIGFLAGGIFLRLLERLLPHLHPGTEEVEGPKSSFNRSLLMIIAITIHNLPEGFAIGVAFGAANSMLTDVTAVTVSSAIALTLGIAIQDVPEGFAVSMPLRVENFSRRKAFFWGFASAIVEPIGAILGALLVEKITATLPFVLAFAAGAMIFVVAEEIIPQSQTGKYRNDGTFSLMIGFALMMVLDIVLG